MQLRFGFGFKALDVQGVLLRLPKECPSGYKVQRVTRESRACKSLPNVIKGRGAGGTEMDLALRLFILLGGRGDSALQGCKLKAT